MPLVSNRGSVWYFYSQKQHTQYIVKSVDPHMTFKMRRRRERRERRTQHVRVVPASVVTERITSIVMSIPVNIIILISIVLWTVSTPSSTSTSTSTSPTTKTTIFQGVMSFSREIVGGTIKVSPCTITTNSKFETSLAIIPPIEDWDKLQRARHYARDPVFHEWPPAIRLFHPFDKSPNAAFDVAQVIEDLEIKSFNITLDSWVIVPNIEATKKEWENQKLLPDVEESGTLDSYYEQLNQESDKEVQELILSEERKAKYKAMKKYDGMSSAQQKRQDAHVSSGPPSRVKKSPAEKREEQRKMIEDDFGGPCILCLEPNEESKEMLSELRESLREGLDLDSYSSPSSLYSWEFVQDGDMGYRPLIPISKYNSLQTAIDVARRLKGLWGDPLVIEVKCLEILSCKIQDETISIDDPFGDIPLPTNQNGPQDSSEFEWKKDAWGRNSKIMLVGEEVDQDEEANEKMIEQLLESGETGGGDISVDYTILDDEEEENDSNIIKWLDEEDDDFDEGTHVIIGRTHFFTGDQRNYQGMPATSVVDAKDRSLGEAGAVSGLARRRGVPCRKQNVWDDGEYGRRNKDFMPWGLRERKEKQKYTWIEEEKE
ncbi:hypothetical protein FRACYDRAFT_260142 [Fragilariopsis cylindrus CCMP1102]|uniref:Uncharacterized protein n=1 Tax=Fragilariopsis cylindrus CCMP1102 TaxID=635003 RepID=A0A1E7FNY9_9STRA|nr:hypothetical protein FRACYDRAFT_260142 [Fragilariopsis cylindrus CCMP1102]|eukprot:OEU19878.1 hypothetical protein FRACYDRAFT_260142 [Fragilariopsis cylindrus CCMP1102]